MSPLSNPPPGLAGTGAPARQRRLSAQDACPPRACCKPVGGTLAAAGLCAAGMGGLALAAGWNPLLLGAAGGALGACMGRHLAGGDGPQAQPAPQPQADPFGPAFRHAMVQRLLDKRPHDTDPVALEAAANGFVQLLAKTLSAAKQADRGGAQVSGKEWESIDKRMRALEGASPEAIDAASGKFYQPQVTADQVRKIRQSTAALLSVARACWSVHTQPPPADAEAFTPHSLAERLSWLPLASSRAPRYESMLLAIQGSEILSDRTLEWAREFVRAHEFDLPGGVRRAVACLSGPTIVFSALVLHLHPATLARIVITPAQLKTLAYEARLFLGFLYRAVKLDPQAPREPDTFHGVIQVRCEREQALRQHPQAAGLYASFEASFSILARNAARMETLAERLAEEFDTNPDVKVQQIEPALFLNLLDDPQAIEWIGDLDALAAPPMLAMLSESIPADDPRQAGEPPVAVHTAGTTQAEAQASGPAKVRRRKGTARAAQPAEPPRVEAPRPARATGRDRNPSAHHHPGHRSFRSKADWKDHLLAIKARDRGFVGRSEDVVLQFTALVEQKRQERRARMSSQQIVDPPEID